jgi:hypothetical protein
VHRPHVSHQERDAEQKQRHLAAALPLLDPAHWHGGHHACGTCSLVVIKPGNHPAMSQGLTYEQAAAILGCYFSNVAKLIRKGDLTSTGKRGASLNRELLEALAERQAAKRAATATRSPHRYQRLDHRPDQIHEWLSPRQVAETPGRHAATGPGPHSTRHPASGGDGGRLWVRRDHLEQVEAARLVQKTRRRDWCRRRSGCSSAHAGVAPSRPGL